MIRMNLFALLAPAALACAALMSGCSSEPHANNGGAATESSYTSVGSYIPRKKSTGPGANNVGNVDLQSLENARNNGNGVMNLPVK